MHQTSFHYKNLCSLPTFIQIFQFLSDLFSCLVFSDLSFRIFNFQFTPIFYVTRITPTLSNNEQRRTNNENRLTNHLPNKRRLRTRLHQHIYIHSLLIILFRKNNHCILCISTLKMFNRFFTKSFNQYTMNFSNML